MEAALCAIHRNGPGRHRDVGAALVLAAVACLTPVAGNAYTAAGDRNFPATLVLPQVAPSDAFWFTPGTLPISNGDRSQYSTQLSGTYSKTLTERLGLQLEDGFTRLGSRWGAQNLDVQLQYEAILDPAHEFVLSVQVDHEFGGTGSRRVGSSPQGATQPSITFAKGLGDLPIGHWRPLAITGFAGYQIADGGGNRPNLVQAGLSVQYSFPYLASKVASVNLPPFLRDVIPITEFRLTTGAGNGARARDQGMTLLVAPGAVYSPGNGLEFGIEAQIPTNRATGRGVGVIAQLEVQLDYLLPESVFGRPIFHPR